MRDASINKETKMVTLNSKNKLNRSIGVSNDINKQSSSKRSNNRTPKNCGESGSNPREFKLSTLRHIDIFVEVLERKSQESKILPKYQPKEIVPLEDIIRSTWCVYDNLIVHHGLKGGTKIWKEFRNYTLRQARGQPLTSLSVITATGKKDRVISKFHNLRPLIFSSINGCAKAYQVINSILYASRLDTRLPDTKKYSVDDVLYHFRCNPLALEKYRAWLKSKIVSGAFCVEEVPKGKFPLEIPLTSSSPRGGLNFSTLEAQCFDLYGSKLFNPFKNLCEHLGDADFPIYVKSLALRFQEQNKGIESSVVRRITRVSDSDVKDRIIAIVDWCSQVVAARIQSTLYRFLEKNLTQYTDIFDHSKGALKVLSQDPELTSFTSPNDTYILKCTDFDAWTWKFSKEPQIIFLEEVLGKGVSDPFTPLILDCEWSTDLNKTGFNSVKAGSGQAMGSKASFILATVTSITIILAANDGVFDDFLSEQDRKALEDVGMFGIPSKPVFSETGDDIIMYDYFNRTESCLSLFGNTINKSKSVYSTDYPAGEIHRFTEYLSRVSMNFEDCSRVSLKLCRLGAKHFTYVPHLLTHLEERGCCVLDSHYFDTLWSKTKGPIKDSSGNKWIDNLRSIMTLSNPTNLPNDLLIKLSFIREDYSKEYISTFKLRECLLLAEECLDKMKDTATSFKNNRELLLVTTNSVGRPLYLADNEENVVSCLDLFWGEYTERTGHIVTEIKRFVHSKSGSKKPPILSPYILPRFMTKANLEETLLGMDLEESKNELDVFINLLTKESRSVDGTYPTMSDKTNRYKNLSSLTIRTINSEGPSFERLDEKIGLAKAQEMSEGATGVLDSSLSHGWVFKQ
jgi:hypothetical protein